MMASVPLVLHPLCSVLTAASGDILIQNASSRLIVCDRDKDVVAALIGLSDGASPRDAIVAQAGRATGSALELVERRLDHLLGRGVLVPKGWTRPKWMSDRQWDVQQANLNWFWARDAHANPPAQLRHLAEARICFIGLGGSGSLSAQLLVASGARRIRLVDGDTVSRHNLGRQFLYCDVDIGLLKTRALAKRLTSYDPELDVEELPLMIASREDAASAVAACDFVLVTADQPPGLLMRWISEAARAAFVPVLPTFFDRYGPLYVPGVSPCYECVERMWREQSPLYDTLVGATPAGPSRTLPSTPTDIAVAAAVYVKDVVAWLTRIERPQSLGAIVGRAAADGGLQPVPLSCGACRSMCYDGV